jgi:hypothetical protein
MVERKPSEVERLRAEVEQLRAELASAPATVPLPVEKPDRSGWWRPVVVTVLVVLITVLAPLAVVARWAHNEVADTDRYVESIAPLADDPDVQAAVTDKITAEITARLQVQAVTQDAIDALSERGLPPLAASSLDALGGPLANAIESFIHDQVARLVASDEFKTAWVESNRRAHAQLVAVLTGKDTELVEITNNAVNLNLGAVVEAVKQRLIDRGFTLAERLPTIETQFTIFQSDDITKAQSAFRLLSALNTLLPILLLLMLAAAMWISRRRRRTLIATMLAVAASMLVLGVVLNAFRIVYLDAVPTDQIPVDAAAAIYDTLVWFIRVNLRAILVLTLAVALIAWVSGPGGTAVTLRRGAGGAFERARHGGERIGVNTGRFGEFLGTYKVPIRGAVLGLALLAYAMADHPTARFTIGLLVIAAFILLVVELLARPPVAPVVPDVADVPDVAATPPAPPPPSS